MTARNWPADCRPAGRGGPDERARPPGELLDNLRLRLSQLAANHPSAPGDGSGRGERASDSYSGAAGDGWPGDGGGGPGDGGPGDGGPGDGRRGEGQPGRGAPEGIPAQDAAGAGGGGASGRAHGADAASAPVRTPAGPGVLATMELPGRGGHGDAYRPWFMAGEPGSPWWTGTLY